ncbi:sigma-70 family RNA polymerase sigma factor [Oscillibacter sp.]|uniref:sigma-70 family RNA polymerase sigma factor n=1 Tax=Oscillibacter sp. TaxID=1945593 RepID=UPI0028B01C2A|nr:sigma-70 family RNA polymerase sigma factor [Oscillibacter sp.]
MREEKNRAAPLPDYHKCGAMSPDRERVLLRAIQEGRAAKEQLQQHTVRLEDIAAAKRDIANGVAAREELTLSYLPLLAIIAKRYSYGNSISMEDLMQEGALGLLEAIETCNEIPLNFPAIITVRIRQALGRLIGQKNAVHIPHQVTGAIQKIRTTSECFSKETGCKPEVNDIAEEMTIPPAIVRMLLNYTKSFYTRSLDAPVSDESDSATFGDLFVKDEPTPEELAEHRELREQVREVLATLEPAEESAIRLRFGFVGGEVYTAEETAEELNLPLDQEQRVEIKAMRKLRHPSRSSFLRDYL